MWYVISNWNTFYHEVEWNYFNAFLVLQYMFVFHYACFSLLTGFTGLKSIMWLLSFFNIGIFFIFIAVGAVEFFSTGAVDPNLWGGVFDFFAIAVTLFGWMKA